MDLKEQDLKPYKIYNSCHNIFILDLGTALMSFVSPLLLSVLLLSLSCFLVVGLISVPWPVLVLVLIAGLFVTQRALGDSASDFDSLLSVTRENSFRD